MPAHVVQGCAQFFLPGVFNDGRSGRVELLPGWEEMSGKFALVANMLAVLYAETDDRIVIVSNYTQVPILCHSLHRCLLFTVLFGCTYVHTSPRSVSHCVWWRPRHSGHRADRAIICIRRARRGPALCALLLVADAGPVRATLQAARLSACTPGRQHWPEQAPETCHGIQQCTGELRSCNAGSLRC